MTAAAQAETAGAPQAVTPDSTTKRHPAAACRIVHIRPAGYVHTEALTEFAESVYHGLRRLGIEVYYRDPAPESARQIVFGAHLLGEQGGPRLAPDAIIYNSEQITPDSPWLQKPYWGLLKTHAVWDYSAENARRLAALGIRVVHVPLGYVPELSRIAPGVEDVDVLFYGSLNARRRAILDALQRRGLRVQVLFGVYGEARDREIARAKIVLNVHFFEAKIFEIVRVSYLLTNFKAVVAECGPDTLIEPGLREAICAVPYDGLVEACVALVQDEAGRQALAMRGHRAFAARPAETALAAALGLPPPIEGAIHGNSAAVPPILHIGGTGSFVKEFFNVAGGAGGSPDAMLDLSAADLLGRHVQTVRFGEVALEDDMFEAVIADQVLAHFTDLSTAMRNVLRLLKPGGLLTINVAYDLGASAWQDPRNVRTFNEYSWAYYTERYADLEWHDACFSMMQLEFLPGPLGAAMHQAGRDQAEILRTPRAIEAMRVVLRKRYLQDSERTAALARRSAGGTGAGA